jgi:hypothetical protein
VNFKALAQQATHRALRVRQQNGLNLSRAISVYDLAHKMGFTVRFTAAPSLEGMYEPGSKPVIVLNALRPAGRQRFTCAHEIGHHIFGHGTRIDEILETDEPNGFDPEEYLAHRFAAALLMPKLAIQAALSRRGWQATTATPEQFFVIAQSLGVGYTTLVGYVGGTLHLLPPDATRTLERKQLKKIRRFLAGFDVLFDLFAVDQDWGERPVEAEVGDVLLLPPSAEVRGGAIQRAELPKVHFVATAPGHAVVMGAEGGWTARILVARRDYEGSARYRSLEDPDYGG